MSWLAITLFTLREGKALDDFRQHSIEFVRPGMMKMPSVLGFRDYAVTGTLDQRKAKWDAVEVIEISSPEAFDRDNSGPHGQQVADDWLKWVDQFEVLFCQNLAAYTGAGPGVGQDDEGRPAAADPLR